MQDLILEGLAYLMEEDVMIRALEKDKELILKIIP